MRAGPQSQDGLNGTYPGVCVCVCVCVCVYIHYINMSLKLSSFNAFFKKPGELTYISPIAMRRPKEYGFCAVLV